MKLSMLNKKAETPVSTRRIPMYQVLANSAASSQKIRLQANRLEKLIKNSNTTVEEFDILKTFRDTIKLHGANEALFSCINEDEQLSRCLNIVIPEITSVNAQAVGISCCEAIEEKLEGKHCCICKYLKDLLGTVSSFVNTLNENVICQKETLKVVLEEAVKSVQYVHADEFSKEVICGFAQPVFMERVEAIKEIIAGAVACTSEADVQGLIPALKKLGYIVDQCVCIRPENINEAKAEEPAKEEVMSAPVEEADGSEEELVPETEDQNKEAIPAADPASATDDLQNKPVAVLRWTPTLIADAVKAVIDLLERAGELSQIGEKITKICNEAEADVDEAGKTPEVKAKLDADRRFASFLSSILHILAGSINGLVDQCVCMSTILKKYEAPAEEAKTPAPVVPAAEITPEKPLADKCSGKGPRFLKKTLKNEETPAMNVPEKEVGTSPIVPPAESGDSQKEVKQEDPVKDPSMTVEPKQENIPAGKTPEEGGKKEDAPQGDKPTGEFLDVKGTELSEEDKKNPKFVEKIKEKIKSGDYKTVKIGLTKTDEGTIPDEIVAPTSAPVVPVPETAPAPTTVAPAAAPAEPAPVEPAPAAPAEPVSPVVNPEAPATQLTPAEPKKELVEDPIVAPLASPIVQGTDEAVSHVKAGEIAKKRAIEFVKKLREADPEKLKKIKEAVEENSKDEKVPAMEVPEGEKGTEPIVKPAESGDEQKKVEQPDPAKPVTENAPKGKETDPSMTVDPKEAGTQPLVEPAKSGDEQKEVKQPEEVKTEQDPVKVEEKPAENEPKIQHPEARKQGVIWF